MATKKELKEAYKQMKFRMGVYQIRNTSNGKIFVDGSTNLDAIWNRHRMQLNFGNHRNTALQQEWQALGEAHFQYEILAELDQENDATIDYNKEVQTLTDMYIEELQPFAERGYNRSPKA